MWKLLDLEDVGKGDGGNGDGDSLAVVSNGDVDAVMEGGET